ncbi:hypothetical protein RvY_18298 [Ramazzottius varieornatus]|uniref:Uncharacterized protein n=1 Tax=Ramazzottius varieornatus TaxID=947166 RepID=A0A1D1WA87_RAMVA|nr:hypothetical protein RvY_18298 [Ramazzottius varieornatus]
MNQPRGTYNRFRIEEDIWLCEEVLKADPFNCEHKNVVWLQIVDNLNSIPIFAKPTGERACKHRLDDLLSQYRLQEIAKLKRSGSEEQYQMLWGLLVQIDHLREISLDDEAADDKPVMPRSKEKSSKRSFPMSMAQPTEIQQRVQAMQFPISPPAKKQRAHAAPQQIMVAMSPTSSTHSINTSQNSSSLREPSASPPLATMPRISTSAYTLNLSSTSNTHDYVIMLIQQNKNQLDLYERELQQSRKLREKELDLERARLDFEEKKWKQFVEQNQLQHDLLKDVLLQQREAHQALLALLKSPTPEPRNGQLNGYSPDDS